MKKHCPILILLTAIFIATAASAAWVPLTGNPVSISSLQGNPFIFGDKKVSNINLFGNGTGGAITPSADSVFIQGGQDTTTGDYGLRFVLSWAAFSNQTINADIQFKVSVLPGYDNYYIKDVQMDISSSSATGTGGVAIGETVRTAPLPGGDVIASLSCSKSANDRGAFLKDSDVFTPVKEIWIWSKDVSITGGTECSAHLSEFYQFYSQTQVPEPATIALLTIGALALLKRKSRK
jgi:hypothetical protein